MMKLLHEIRAVKRNGRRVFVGFNQDIPAEPMWLLHQDEKVSLEEYIPSTIASSRSTISALHPKANVGASVLRGDEVLPADACNIMVNAIEGWFIDGYDTLQVEFNRKYSPFRLTFPETLELEATREPMVFKAQMAAHRFNGSVCVEFTDLDTGFTSTQEVRLDNSFAGGKRRDNYQPISIPVPAAMHRVSARVSLNYIGTTEPHSIHEPFAFLYDVCLQVEPVGTKVSSEFYDNDLLFKWMKADVEAEIHPLDCLFVEHRGHACVLPTDEVKRTRAYFDERYYRAKNSDIDFSKVDEYSHYLNQGWKECRNPGPEFSVREYLLRHPDVEISGDEPLMHYANVGQEQMRSIGTFNEKLLRIWSDAGRQLPDVPETTILMRAQDMMLPMNIIDAKRIAVFVIPEHNSMSGGIYSMFSIADHVRRTRRQHGFDVLVMTRPNADGLTYVRNSAFKNSETVYRFEQLRLFSEVSELQIHIPEYATVEFVRSLSPEMMRYLLSRDHVHINILNQNIRLMPESKHFQDLRRIANTVGQSVSHHSFFGQEFADRYELPSLLLPAYTDLTAYPPVGFNEKDNLIIYSDDEAPYRRAVLEQLEKMTDYTLIKIKDMTFDTYMDLATRCRFSVSFGEGFDGYVAQPMYQGGIGFALYTDEFFPDESYRNFENFFSSEEEMIAQIVPTIRKLEANRKRYESLNRAMRAKWDELYSYEDYVARIGKLIRKEYEVYPNDRSEQGSFRVSPSKLRARPDKRMLRSSKASVGGKPALRGKQK